jgi:putative phosphoribosyl transferase
MQQAERFADRAEAGRRLGAAVARRLPAGGDPVVLALPRGGVVVAAEVARALQAPLDVVVVRKLGVPGQPELAFGAVAAGVRVTNDAVVTALGLSAATVERVAAGELAAAERRERLYRGVRTAVPLSGRTVVVVDDGLATGATARAALRAVRLHTGAHLPWLVLAVPVAPPSTLHTLSADADDLVCLLSPPAFTAVGTFYDDFRQVQDDEVMRLLSHS